MFGKRLLGSLCLLCIVWIGLAASSCTGSNAPGTENGSELEAEGEKRTPGGLPPLDPPVDLRVATPGTVAAAPLYVAEAQGYFDALGIEVEIVSFPTAADVLPAVATGWAGVGVGLPSQPLFAAVARGVPVRLIADGGRNEPGGAFLNLVAARGRGARFPTFASLAEARIGLLSHDSAAEYVIWKALQRGEVSLEEATRIRLPDRDGLIEALVGGTIDLALLAEPHVTAGVKGGRWERWRDTSEFARGAQMGVLLAGGSVLEREELAQRVAVAYLAGLRDYERIRASREQLPALVELLARTGSAPMPRLWGAEGFGLPRFDWNGHVSLEDLTGQIGFLREVKGTLTHELSPVQAVDHRFVDFAASRLMTQSGDRPNHSTAFLP